MQIETGCLAIIINSGAGNDGTCVTVGKFIGRIEFFMGSRRWEVDKKLRSQSLTGAYLGQPVDHAQESQLMRIDNFQGDEAFEAESLLLASDEYNHY